MEEPTEIVIIRVWEGASDERKAVQLWAAALPREEAVAAVQAKFPHHWTAQATDHKPSAELVDRLRLKPGQVFELSSAPKAGREASD